MDSELRFELFDDEMIAQSSLIRSTISMQARDNIAHNLLHHGLAATKNYKTIPNPQKNLYLIGLGGFGYDCKIDDYKVVILWNLYSSNQEDRCLLDVYTLGKNSWKSSKIELDMVPWRQDIGVLGNGALHWSGKWRDKRSKLIISLDISDEKFKQVELPEGDLENSDFCMTVGALEGSLCVLDGGDMVQLEVWVMQDYGVRESWTKRYTITHEMLTKFSFWMCYLTVKLMGSFKSGEILFWTDGKLVLYYPKHSSARVLAYCWKNVVDAMNYFES
ncbi:F-box protein CPR1-like [Papaver somniferum]|uniref:F-box protein CPR1-like n=1 Tax=Papaver somniferum TaxID=3469 RepID=UPI000E6F95E9|nr:F-box protein CPR1-like [Papaver somniferum]